MAHEILMPKLGLTMTEGTVEEWKFKEGDTVKKNDVLAVIEAMKMENNVDSDKEGTVAEIRVGTGDSVLEGDVLIVIE